MNTAAVEDVQIASLQFLPLMPPVCCLWRFDEAGVYSSQILIFFKVIELFTRQPKCAIARPGRYSHTERENEVNRLGQVFPWSSGRLIFGMRMAVEDDFRHGTAPIVRYCGRTRVPPQQQCATLVALVAPCGVQHPPLSDDEIARLYRHIDSRGMVAEHVRVGLRHEVSVMCVRDYQLVVQREALQMRARNNPKTAVLDCGIDQIVGEK